MNAKDTDYCEYVEIAPGVYWVGYADADVGLHCNPYLIVDQDEAVLLDGGSRNDFSTVMLKVMRTGTSPQKIQRLIYHHYDPDLCGNIPHLEALIHNDQLRIISHYENNIFINYYSPESPKDCIEQLGYSYRFASGRELKFFRTPYCHSPGSFVTYDTQSHVLFSSDLFGSYDNNWNLFTGIDERCDGCAAPATCPQTGKPCQLRGMMNFHQRIMTSRKALNYALDRIEELTEVELIAPQHGSILNTPLSRKIAIDRLHGLADVGFDHFLKEKSHEKS